MVTVDETSNEVKNAETNTTKEPSETNDADKFKQAVKSAMDNEYRSGMIVGMATLGKAILNTMNNKKKTLPGICSDIRRLCITATNAAKNLKKEEPVADDEGN